jgi:hypothetical protein
MSLYVSADCSARVAAVSDKSLALAVSTIVTNVIM